MKKEIMRHLSVILALFLSFCSIVSCAQGKADKDAKTQETISMKAGKKILVAFFSHTGENYAVGEITKGNTHIVAEMIAENTGGKLFEIVPVREYPKTYNACVDVAKKEKEAGARPAVKYDTAVEEYDVVFLGYPNWWGDMPMPVYTFIEKHKWQGKTVIPFCTHEGSGLSSTERYIAEACKGATVEKGLAVRGATAQNKREQARESVAQWLKRLGFEKEVE